MSEDKKIYQEESFWVGVGSYYILVWILTLYPAIVVGIAVSQLTNIGHNTCESFPDCSQCSIFPCLIATIMAYFFILAMYHLRQYLIVLIFYIVTIWPFLYVIHWYFNCPDGKEFPLPILDFWPLW